MGFIACKQKTCRGQSEAGIRYPFDPSESEMIISWILDRVKKRMLC